MLKRRSHFWRKQQGAISLLGAASIALSLYTFNLVLDFGNAKLLDRKLDNYARDIASVALRSELAVTQATADKAQTSSRVDDILAKVGMNLSGEDINLQKKIVFGNFDEEGNFQPLEENEENPKNVQPGQTPPQFSAVAVQLWSTESFFGFTPQGKALYGLDLADENSPDMANCFCNVRYDSCLEAPRTSSVMGSIGSDDRKKYCEYGTAPVSGSFMMQSATYSDADAVKLSPQWIGTPYSGDPATDQEGTAWSTVQNAEPLAVSSGVNPFPEASWDAANANWLPGNYPMSYSSTSCSFFGCSTSTKNISGSFYMGRSGTCADPGGFFFFQMMSQMMSFMSGNTDCLRYTAQPALQYEFASPIEAFMQGIIGSTGANEHYYSCRDFSGLTSSRSGFFQIFFRLWSSPVVSWESSYQSSDCAVKEMRYRGWWFWGGWEEV